MIRPDSHSPIGDKEKKRGGGNNKKKSIWMKFSACSS